VVFAPFLICSLYLLYLIAINPWRRAVGGGGGGPSGSGTPLRSPPGVCGSRRCCSWWRSPAPQPFARASNTLFKDSFRHGRR